MPRVSFTPNLQRHVDCPPVDVKGSTLRDALDAAFATHPAARDYVLDEHGAVRRHMVIFVDGEMARDREKLSDAVKEGAEIFVMQALSGG